MTSLLDINSTSIVLEIGTGSGYQAAILSTIAKKVYSIEVVEELATKAKQLLLTHNFTNITCIYGNGYYGWPEDLQFDAIIVTAVAKKIPEKLLGQLKAGSKMVIPLEDATGEQTLCVVEKLSPDITDLKITEIIPVRFVPMVHV
jgi:protein-L-isoaspartate(D-aspartate) O-methyltransferase